MTRAERQRAYRRRHGQLEDRDQFLERHARERVLKAQLGLQTVRAKNLRGK
jgi:hypothetical protein